VRWDSPFVLAVAGTIAIHVILIVAADAIVVYNPARPPKPAPRIEMVEVEIPPMIKAEPPPPITPPEPLPEPDPPKVATKTPVKSTPTPEPPPVAPVQPVVSDTGGEGGDQVVTLDSAQTGGIGVPVGIGKVASNRIGRGGQGGGTGAGSGAGAAPEAPKPVSVATIKKRALPKGVYGYFDAGKDYPAEARQMGIEGPIRVRLVVDDKGKVTSKVLLNKLGHGLDELALKRASEIEFEPALDTDNRAVSSVVIWTFNMTLPK
jgi:protein TonB